MARVVAIMLLLNLYLFSKGNIVVYSAYGNMTHINIQGRMQKIKNFKSVEAGDNWLKNSYRRLREVETHEIKNRTIIANIDGAIYETKGDNEGYFNFNINLAKPVKDGYKEVLLNIKDSKNITKTKALILSKPLIGIISDFDDTLIVSNVTDKLKLGANTLFKNYKQRKAVDIMDRWFKEILAKNPKNSPSTLFIVTGSPLQLYRPIKGFLKYHNFPQNILLLKKLNGKNSDSISKQFSYKVKKIEKLIKLYPNMRWYMFGDSGEKDSEVYAHIKAKYPKKIIKYNIRDIKTGNFDSFR